jgi:hypothetical protein
MMINLSGYHGYQLIDKTQIMKKNNSNKTAHSPKKLKNIPWTVCKYCGLVYLKNKRTRRAIKKGCRDW